jgi:ketosteroid isomerase-like protein
MNNDIDVRTDDTEHQGNDGDNMPTSPLSVPEDNTKALRPQLIETNQKFYNALRTCSIRSMEEVWLQTDDVVCIHPGWMPLKGWAQIKESWSRIFQNTHMHQVTTQVVEMQIHGTVGWLTCVEQIGVYHGDRAHVAFALSTNIYTHVDNTWKLILHHGSPLPQPSTRHIEQ